MTLTTSTPARTSIDTQIVGWNQAGDTLFETEVCSILDGFRLLQEKHWTEVEVITVLPNSSIIVKDRHSGCTAMITEVLR